MRIRVAGIAAALVLGCAGMAFAGDGEDVTKEPGYVDFGTLAIFGHKEADVEVLLEQTLLKAVGDMSGDPELKAMLAKLKQIRVQSFAIEPDKLEAIEKKTADVARKLESQGWSPMVKVVKPRLGERTYVYMKMSGSLIQGMTVMNVDPEDDASFVNIVGEIDPEQIGKLSQKFHLSGMDSVKIRSVHETSDDEKKPKDE
jgi:hypothetical protein